MESEIEKAHFDFLDEQLGPATGRELIAALMEEFPDLDEWLAQRIVFRWAELGFGNGD